MLKHTCLILYKLTGFILKTDDDLKKISIMNSFLSGLPWLLKINPVTSKLKSILFIYIEISLRLFSEAYKFSCWCKNVCIIMFIDVEVLLSPRTKFDNDVYKYSLGNRDLIYWLISYIEKNKIIEILIYVTQNFFQWPMYLHSYVTPDW